MWEKIGTYFVSNMSNISSWIDSVSFSAAALLLFFGGIKKETSYGRTAAVAALHFVGIFAALLFMNVLVYIIGLENWVMMYIPKALVLGLYAVFFNHYKWQSRIILSVLLYALHNVFIELGASLQGICNASGEITLPESFRCYFIPLTIVSAAVLRYCNVNRFRIMPLRTVVWSVGYSAIGIILSVLRSVVMPYLLVFERTEYYLYGLYPQIYIFVTLLCITAFLFACYFFMVRDLESHEENMELSKKALHKEVSETLVAINENNLAQLRKIRHDMKNRYALMQVMLQNKQYDQLEKYFNEINNESATLFRYVDTGNSSFDTIVNLELSKAAAKQIEVSTKLIVPPTLPFAETDLSGLITNLMDNAIEACEKIPKDRQRSIDVSVQVVHSYFVLRISNTVADSEAATALRLETDKPNKELHGYGSKIVNGIVAKYDGQILRRLEDGKFLVDVMLDLDHKSKE